MNSDNTKRPVYSEDIRKYAAMILLKNMMQAAKDYENLTPTERQSTVADVANTLAEYAKAIATVCP